MKCKPGRDKGYQTSRILVLLVINNSVSLKISQSNLNLKYFLLNMEKTTNFRDSYYQYLSDCLQP